MQTIDTLPTEVVIEITSKCNFDCHGCFNRASFAHSGRREKLETDYIKKIIDSAVDAEIKMIRFTGGEALLSTDLFELISYAKKKGVHTRLNTNGSLITPEHADYFDKYLDSILISFNGHNQESDEAWTNTPNSFKNKLEGLKLLNSIRTQIRIGTVLTSSTIENLEAIYSLISSFNISHWEVYRKITPEIKEDLKDNIETVIQKLAVLSVRFGSLIPIANSIPFCLYDKATMSKICNGALSDDGHSRIIVDPRGFAKPSYYINENIGDPRDILSCWNHPFMKKMRSLQMIPADCHSCSFLNLCRGGSRYKAHAAFGSYDARDPLMPT